jgi:hypothetical protein
VNSREERQHFTRAELKTAKAAAIAGMVFSVLVIAVFLLLPCGF